MPNKKARTIPLRGRRSRGRSRRLLVLLLSVASVAAGGSFWRVREIRVTGARLLSVAQIVDVSGLRGNESMILPGLKAIEERLEAVPEIRSVSAGRFLPAGLVLRVTERVAVVRLEGAPNLGADEQGKVFSVPEQSPLPGLAGYNGSPSPGDTLGRDHARALAGFAQFPSDFKGLIVRLEVTDSMSAFIVNGPRVLFGRIESLRAKGIAAAAIIRDANSRKVVLDVIDVRSPAAPISQVVTPPPTPKASARPRSSASTTPARPLNGE